MTYKATDVGESLNSWMGTNTKATIARMKTLLVLQNTMFRKQEATIFPPHTRAQVLQNVIFGKEEATVFPGHKGPGITEHDVQKEGSYG